VRERADRAATYHRESKKLARRLPDASLAAMRKREEGTWPAAFHAGTKLQHYFFEVAGAGEIVLSHI
jgi:hypothetical protein